MNAPRYYQIKSVSKLTDENRLSYYLAIHSVKLRKLNEEREEYPDMWYSFHSDMVDAIITRLTELS